MMLGVSTDAWGALGVIFGVVSGIVTALFAWGAQKTKIAHDAEMEVINTNHRREMDGLENEVKNVAEKSLIVENNLKAAWTKIDDLRDNVVRKAEFKEYRDEVKEDIKALGLRIEVAIKELVNKNRGSNA